MAEEVTEKKDAAGQNGAAGDKRPRRRVSAAKKPPAEPVVPRIERVEYIDFDTALGRDLPNRKDASGYQIDTARTSRFKGARVFRTGQKQITIQNSLDEEFTFDAEALTKIIEIAMGMEITRRIPSFGS